MSELFAVVTEGSKQFYISKVGQVILTEKKELEIDSKVELPIVFASTGVTSVSAVVINHQRAKKVIIFKKKRRHNYRRKKGHKQHLTALRIVSIS